MGVRVPPGLPTTASCSSERKPLIRVSRVGRYHYSSPIDALKHNGRAAAFEAVGCRFESYQGNQYAPLADVVNCARLKPARFRFDSEREHHIPNVPVAQWIRASRFERECRRFDSYQGLHFDKECVPVRTCGDGVFLMLWCMRHSLPTNRYS